jgi:hypothetical protein
MGNERQWSLRVDIDAVVIATGINPKLCNGGWWGGLPILAIAGRSLLSWGRMSTTSGSYQ